MLPMGGGTGRLSHARQPPAGHCWFSTGRLAAVRTEPSSSWYCRSSRVAGSPEQHGARNRPANRGENRRSAPGHGRRNAGPEPDARDIERDGGAVQRGVRPRPHEGPCIVCRGGHARGHPRSQPDGRRTESCGNGRAPAAARGSAVLYLRARADRRGRIEDERSVVRREARRRRRAH